ncbi:Potassium channel KOR1, partial [Ananas comosus]
MRGFEGESSPTIHLCTTVSRGDADFIKRAISYGPDPNSKHYDHRTPLHIAAAEGLYLKAKQPIDAGASVLVMY